MSDAGVHKHMGKNLGNPKLRIQWKMHGKQIVHLHRHNLSSQKHDYIDNNQVFYSIGCAVHHKFLLFNSKCTSIFLQIKNYHFSFSFFCRIFARNFLSMYKEAGILLILFWAFSCQNNKPEKKTEVPWTGYLKYKKRPKYTDICS